jgi:hypothetical protein
MEDRERAAREAASVLAQALSEAHALLARAAEEEAVGGRRRREEPARPRKEPPPPQAEADTRILPDQFVHAIDLIGAERRLLADQVSILGEAVQRLEERLGDLDGLMRESRALAVGEARPGRREAVAEGPKEAFSVGGEGIQVVVSAVPGFQELMELQRALMRLKAVERASVERYFDGEARVILMLREPLTASDVVDAIREATGHQLAVDEARPSALRLRLRFLEGEA